MRQHAPAALYCIHGIGLVPRGTITPHYLVVVCNWLRTKIDLSLPNWFCGEKPSPFSNSELELASFAVWA